MEQKNKTHQRHDDKFLQQLEAEVFNGALYQNRAVIGWHNLYAWRQTALQGFDLFFDRRNGFQRVFARPHDDDAASRFTLAIQLADTTPHLGAELYARYITQAHRNTCAGGSERDFAEVVKACQIA